MERADQRHHYVNNIEAALSAASPADAATFKANADAYQRSRPFTTGPLLRSPNCLKTSGCCHAHDAFGYLESAYGLTFLAPQGIDTEAEPSAKELAGLISFLKDIAGVPFVENIANGGLIAQIRARRDHNRRPDLFRRPVCQRSPASYLAMFTHNLICSRHLRQPDRSKSLKPGPYRCWLHIPFWTGQPA